MSAKFVVCCAAAIGGIAGIIGGELVVRYFSQHDLAENLKRRSRNEIVSSDQIQAEFAKLESQFADDEVFARALSRSHLTSEDLRTKIATLLREVAWTDKQIVSKKKNDRETATREFYDLHRDLFLKPARWRAAHLFLAAHAETPAGVTEEKRQSATTLADRISQGESFENLVAEFSEDEATKDRNGDLGFFSTARMPADFLAHVTNLRVGEIAPPFQTHLGFHIVKLLEEESVSEMNFAEARPEIEMHFENLRRREVVAGLARK